MTPRQIWYTFTRWWFWKNTRLIKKRNYPEDLPYGEEVQQRIFPGFDWFFVGYSWWEFIHSHDPRPKYEEVKFP